MFRKCHVPSSHHGDRIEIRRAATPPWRNPLWLTAAGLGAGALLRASRRRRELARERGAAPELVRSAVVDGTVMRWESHGGDGAGAIPVVMVHGIPTGPRLWRFVMPRLRDTGLRCIAWEMVGFGWSIPEGLDRDVSISGQVRHLEALLRYLGIERALFVGHDMGGGVVQRFAVEHPDRCLGLVLTDCVAYDNWPVPAVRAARAMTGLVERLPPSLLGPVLETALRNLGHDDGERRTASTELHMRPYRTALGPAGLAHQLRHLDADDTIAVAGQLERLRVPARVVWGSHDPLAVSSAERLAAELNAPLRVIAGARHFTPEDHPDEIARAIDEVASEVRRGRYAAPVTAATEYE